MNTPVLLITFNRPDYTRLMLESLKRANVSKLYIFKDGPRPNNYEDKKSSKEIEDIIDKIDWDCDVHKLYLNNNIGCGYGPYTAISWAFNTEDRLIILEDDCIPTTAFFTFCTELLDKYKDNNLVRHISGRSPMQGHNVFKHTDYIFTQYAPTWGWATWKRTWDDFDMEMRSLEPFFEKGGYSKQFSSRRESSFFNFRYRHTRRNKSLVFHVWDFQYGLFSRANNSLAIVPAQNLIKYIGIYGTHPVDNDSEHYNLDVNESFTITQHPEEIRLMEEYDSAYFKKFVRPKKSLKGRMIEIINYFLGRGMI